MARRAGLRNRQTRSVGNLGDILKHAALFELASMLARTRAPVRWVETNTFVLHAPLGDAAKWIREVDALGPAYARYASHERNVLAQTGRYRCSSGLVMDVLGDKRTSATLGEADGATRAELREQIIRERLTNVIVSEDDVAALRHASTERGGCVLVHVDPFSLPPEQWSRLVPALEAVCAGARDVVIVVYRYTRSAPSPWPTEPLGDPVAEIRGGPHEVAVYSSPDAADEVRSVCGALGWNLRRE